MDPSYQCNQKRRQFAKSARHHAGLESCLQNQAAATETPPQHPAKEPDKHWHWVFIVASSAASSVLPVPIVNDFEGGAHVVDEDADAAPDASCQ